jgi:hypothetical protein
VDKVRGIIGEQLGLDMDKVRSRGKGCSLSREKHFIPVAFAR